MIAPERYGEFFRSLRRDVVWHDCFSKAAALAFYFQLAIFPLLIFLLSLVGFMSDARQIILFWLGRLMPAETTSLFENWLREVVGRRSSGILSFGLVFSLWSASTGVRTLTSTLNRAYEVSEGRSFWKSQILALALTVALSVLVIGGVVLITFGEQLFGAIGPQVGSGDSVHMAWRAFHYLTGLRCSF